ncbi:site-specific integrase [Bacteroides sp.]|uniref:tyrosine-type recombinase/integrase n=1 Tax=Bacteroides sp. TaxID=29523 RepID=UPI0026357EEF|nr:site-specific integrase [Bacteroides sp.]MDD3036833.1 site-specific integrase [Bacteroides sp.]
MGNLISFMQKVADGLQTSGNYGTAHVYRSSLNALISFHGNTHLPFRKVTPEFIKSFEIHLRGRGCSWNTVSTYMRTLRAVYNRAIECRRAIYIPHLFKYVYTGTRADRKRALDNGEMSQLLNDSSPSTVIPYCLKKTKALFVLMFLLRGLLFVDLAYLKKKDLDENVLTYRRRKTGRQLSVTLTPEAMVLVRKYMNTDLNSPYLFSLITAGEGTKEAYREYQLALRNFNYQLTSLKEILGFTSDLSSYTARHTWATMAYYSEIHPGIISEAMGHSSIMVTETYLKPFRNKKIDESNIQVIDFAKQYFKSVIA